MKTRIAFHQTADERLLVTWEALRGSFAAGQGDFSTVVFEDENELIQQIVLADLPQEQTTTLIAGVLLTVAGRRLPDPWIQLALTRDQLVRLRFLTAPRPLAEPLVSSPEPAELAALHNVIMQTPTPIVVTSGPLHRFSFCNTAYAELMQRPDLSTVLGRTVREVLPELKGQACFELLDEVYRTGKEHIGREVPAMLRNAESGILEQHYFDFIYYPVRDEGGVVTAMVIHATDVTTRILERHVAESREEQLYKQWAELETIYRYSPMAMCLLNARTFRILRINDLTAEQLGDHAENLIGKSVPDLLPNVPELQYLYNLAAKGEVIRNYELSIELPPTSGVMRTWLLTLSPLFDAAGSVEMIESIGVEITDRVDTGMRRRFTDLFHASDAESSPHA